MTAVDTEVAQVEKMFAVNVFGAMRMVHYFHKELIATKGVIINIGSIGGVCPFIYGASYNASKAALHHYGNTLRVEMSPFGVRVMNVISGEVSTNILKADSNRNLPPGLCQDIHNLRSTADIALLIDSIFRPLNQEFRDHVNRKPSENDRGILGERQ
ncbi:MAG: hypothetical protein Q9190_003609 [Brigantiaea leucoxantha]